MSNISRFMYEEMLTRLNRVQHPDTGKCDKVAPLESKLHQQIMDHCDQQWPRWKYIHSRTDKRTTNERGVPDFFIALPNTKGMFVECKRPGEKLTADQLRWYAELKKLGWTVHIVTNLQAFLDAVGLYLSKPGRKV